MKKKKITKGELGLLMSLKAETPKLWEALKVAQSSGLIFIDESHDSITATNRLLLTYPELHETINQIMDHWVLKGTDRGFSQLDFLLNEIGDDNWKN